MMRSRSRKKKKKRDGGDSDSDVSNRRMARQEFIVEHMRDSFYTEKQHVHLTAHCPPGERICCKYNLVFFGCNKITKWLVEGYTSTLTR